MTYLEFREALHGFGVFSVRDASKLFLEFDTRRLVEWQQKGYIRKLINKWYVFSDIPIDDRLQYRIGNCLYRPSYISMESALSYYNLIPEAVFSLQNITTRKTITYETPAGNFHYRSIRPHLFFGYTADRSERLPVLVAEPEKTILDYLYLNSYLNTMGDMEGLRLNMTVFNDIVHWDKLEKYAAYYESPVLNRRIRILQKMKDHADIG